MIDVPEKIEAMRRAYPSLGLCDPPEEGQLIWEGTLCPLRSVDELDAILDDLEHDRDIEIIAGEFSQIVHHSQCRADHVPHRLSPLITQPIQEFKIRIVDFGTDRLPEAKVLDTRIPSTKWQHLRGDSGICAYAPWTYPWRAGSSSIVEFVDHSLIWLFKQIVYLQASVWIGSETPHRAEYLLKTIGPTDKCACGSGENYEDCCRLRHGYQVYGEAWVFFEVWMATHKADRRRFEAVTRQLSKALSLKAPPQTRAAAK